MPRRAQKILIFGAPCSGRTTISTRIAENFKMAHISTSNLIKDALNDHTDKWFANRMKENLQSGDMVVDDFINGIMKERLNRVDCKTMGFCLEGYPKTEAQNKFLKEVIKIQPDIVFVLDCPDHIIYERLN